MISEYFEGIAKLFAECPLISSKTIKTNIYDADFGFIEIRAEFIDSSILQVFELVEEKGGKFDVAKYRYHFEGNDRKITRWDNAPHHKEIKTFPHHKHTGRIVSESPKPTLKEVLEFACGKVGQ